MTDEQKIDKMFSALRKMAGEPIPEKLVDAICDMRDIQQFGYSRRLWPKRKPQYGGEK